MHGALSNFSPIHKRSFTAQMLRLVHRHLSRSFYKSSVNRWLLRRPNLVCGEGLPSTLQFKTISCFGDSRTLGNSCFGHWSPDLRIVHVDIQKWYPPIGSQTQPQHLAAQSALANPECQKPFADLFLSRSRPGLGPRASPSGDRQQWTLNHADISCNTVDSIIYYSMVGKLSSSLAPHSIGHIYREYVYP